MIEIIHGDFKVARCSCGCLFKFKDEYVKHLIRKPLFTFGETICYFFDFVECPKCLKRIYKHKGGWL
jgi:uncharacterized C2H2 Zn-finger protein